jgi:flagellar protein FlgJ
MIAVNDVNNALDLKGLNDIKLQARQGSAEGTRKAAREFEAMFLNMMLKSMRDGLPRDDPFESDATRMATGMLDGQLAQNIAGKGLGLAEAIAKQIERTQGLKDAAQGMKNVMPGAVPIPLKAPEPPPISLKRDLSLKVSPTQRNFVDQHQEAASAAAKASGIPAKFILGQAALESGWGKHEIRDASGSGSFNLFGIKAGSNWKGPTVEAVTTEYIGGVAQKVVQKFRAYASHAEAFLDYAKLIAHSPRYAQAMQSVHDVTRFAQEMGRSGYATDPGYGEKLGKIMSGALRHLA